MAKMNKKFMSAYTESFLAESPEAVFIKGADLAYVGASKAFSDMVGLSSAEEIIGKTDYDLFSEEYATRYTSDDKRIMNIGRPLVNYVEPLPPINGKARYSSTSKYLIRGKRGKIMGIYGSVREVTREVELEKAYKAASAAKTDFLARMSHDMRTPMNGIIGLIELTSAEDDIMKIREYLAKMKTSGEYLLSLINDTLDMNKISSGKIVLNEEPIEGKELLDSIIASVAPTVRDRSIKLKAELLNEDFKCVLLDKVRVQQIFVNIIGNAIKFSKEGGVVELKLDRLALTDKTETILATITDHGIGMSEAFVSRIFEPFVQEKNEVTAALTGTGLGMSIVKNLVDLMGGKIEVKSVKGEGTTVTVELTFPLAKPVFGKADKNNASLMNKRILLAEDNALNAEIASRLLENRGCIVTCVKNGKEAVSTFSSSEEYSFDAILMDIRMPVMDGLEASRNIRSLPRADAETIPIIAMTANAFDEDINVSLSSGMNAHLAKPVEARIMYETLARFISIAGKK